MTRDRIAGVGAAVNVDFADLDARLGRLAAAGCSHAELHSAPLFVALGGRDNTPRMAAVAAICARHRLRYSVHAPVALNLMDAPHLARHEAGLAGVLRFAAGIGAGVVVLHPGRIAARADRAARDRLRAVERDALRRAADRAAAGGQVIALENPNPDRNMLAGAMTSYALDPRALAAEIEAIDHPAICGTLDFGHAWLAAGRLGFDYCAALRDFAPFVGHLHVNDNCGARDGMDDANVPIGCGTVPYDALLSDLPLRDGCAAILELSPRHDGALEAVLAEVGRITDRLNR